MQTDKASFILKGLHKIGTNVDSLQHFNLKDETTSAAFFTSQKGTIYV